MANLWSSPLDNVEDVIIVISIIINYCWRKSGKEHCALKAIIIVVLLLIAFANY